MDIYKNRSRESILIDIHNKMFLKELNTMFLKTSKYLSHFQLKICCTQTVNIRCFVNISNVGKKRSGYYLCTVLFVCIVDKCKINNSFLQGSVILHVMLSIPSWSEGKKWNLNLSSKLFGHSHFYSTYWQRSVCGNTVGSSLIPDIWNLLFCYCLTSTVNSYGHVGTVS